MGSAISDARTARPIRPPASIVGSTRLTMQMCWRQPHKGCYINCQRHGLIYCGVSERCASRRYQNQTSCGHSWAGKATHCSITLGGKRSTVELVRCRALLGLCCRWAESNSDEPAGEEVFSSSSMITTWSGYMK